MPYIKVEERPRAVNNPQTAGELNFALTRMVQSYLGPTPNYGTFNAAIGALECCKLELYRRMVAPYEDKKIQENGDVYGC